MVVSWGVFFFFMSSYWAMNIIHYFRQMTFLVFFHLTLTRAQRFTTSPVTQHAPAHTTKSHAHDIFHTHDDTELMHPNRRNLHTEIYFSSKNQFTITACVSIPSALEGHPTYLGHSSPRWKKQHRARTRTRPTTLRACYLSSSLRPQLAGPGFHQVL